MTTVGQAGATTGLPAEAVTIATALKAMGLPRPVEEPPRRSQRVPAHGARVRRFFGYLLSPGRDGDPCHPNFRKI